MRPMKRRSLGIGDLVRKKVSLGLHSSAKYGIIRIEMAYLIVSVEVAVDCSCAGSRLVGKGMGHSREEGSEL